MQSSSLHNANSSWSMKFVAHMLWAFLCLVLVMQHLITFVFHSSQPTNFILHFFLSHWCIKGPKGIACMAIASKVFPETLAMECMDEFSEAQEKESKKFLGIQKLLA